MNWLNGDINIKQHLTLTPYLLNPEILLGSPRSRDSINSPAVASREIFRVETVSVSELPPLYSIHDNSRNPISARFYPFSERKNNNSER